MAMYLRYGDVTWDALGPTQPTEHSVQTLQRPLRRRQLGQGGGGNGSLSLPMVSVHSVDIHAITEADCIRYILDALDRRHGGVVVTPNLDHVRRCGKDLSFNAIMNEADLVVADGMPLIWASRLQRTPLPERIAGSDLISSLSAAAAERGRSVFFLGGAPGTAHAAGNLLRDRHPQLRVAGAHCPPMGFENDPQAVAEIMDRLSATQPDIIFVALGSPKQELLISRIRHLLPASWWLGVGNSFSFLSGDVRRAPLWMQKYGLEWFHRLCQEPKRLYRRYLLVGLPFAIRMLALSAIKGLPCLLGLKQPPRPAYMSFLSPNMARSEATESASNRGIRNDANHSTDQINTVALPDDGPATPAISISDGGPRVLSRLRGLVLLGGLVRPTQLATTVGRSILDLPLDDGGSILNHWLHHARELARIVRLESLPVRIMVDRNSPEPVSAASHFYGTFRVERDQSDYRGTGGVLRDLAEEYDDEDLLLVANANQVLLDPLAGIAAQLDRSCGDVSLVSHQDGTPCGVMLIKIKTLRMIQPTGFVDMKEQALPLIAAKHTVSVVRRRRPTGLPIRTLADYIGALRNYHRRREGKPAARDPLAEDWRPAFAIVEDGAAVDGRAHIHDSVVLRGGRVEAGAVVVRSVICDGGMVRPGPAAVDRFVCASEQNSK